MAKLKCLCSWCCTVKRFEVSTPAPSFMLAHVKLSATVGPRFEGSRERPTRSKSCTPWKESRLYIMHPHSASCTRRDPGPERARLRISLHSSNMQIRPSVHSTDDTHVILQYGDLFPFYSHYARVERGSRAHWPRDLSSSVV